MATFDLGRVTPIYKGDYEAAASYELNDVVLYNGNLYWHVQPTATIGILPTDTTVWKAAFDGNGIRAEIRGYADDAEASAQAASTSEQSAQAAKTAAQTAEASAQGFAQTATAKASEAANSAAAAESAAVSAEASAQAAGASANTASEVKAQLQDIGETIYQNTDEITSQLMLTGWKLNDDGYRIADENYKLIRYRVFPGNYMRVTSDHKFQFYTDAQVTPSGSNYRIGITYGTGTYICKVPAGALYIVVSTPVENSTASVFKTSSLKNDVDELGSELSEQAAYTESRLAAVNSSIADVETELYSDGTELTVSSEQNGFKLSADGYRVADAGYKLVKYRVYAGRMMKIVAEHFFQYQTSNNVTTAGASYRVGPTYEAGTRHIAVPETALYLIISTPIEGAAHVYNATSKIATADTKAVTAQATGEAAQTAASNAQTAADTAQSTAETAVANAATADGKAETALANAATADNKAGTALTNAATADGKAETATANAATADGKAEKALTEISTMQTNSLVPLLNSYTSQVSDIPYAAEAAVLAIALDTSIPAFTSGAGKAICVPVVGGTNIRVTKPQTPTCVIIFSADYPADGVPITSYTSKTGFANDTFVAASQPGDKFLTIYTGSRTVALEDISFAYAQNVKGTLELLPQLDPLMVNLLKYRPVGKLSKAYIAINCDDGLEPLATYTIPRIKYWSEYYGKDIPLHMALFDNSPVLLNDEYTALVTDMCVNHNCSIGIHGTQPYANYTYTGLYSYLKKQRDFIVDKTGVEPTSVIYPHNSYDDKIMVMAGAYYGICGASGSERPPYTYEDDAGRPLYIGEKTNCYQAYRLSIKDTRVGSATEAHNVIDYAIAHNLIITPYFHDIDFTNYSEATNNFNKAMLDAYIQYGMEQGVEFINFGDIPYLL